MSRRVMGPRADVWSQVLRTCGVFVETSGLMDIADFNAGLSVVGRTGAEPVF